jgi:hypothetical protein
MIYWFLPAILLFAFITSYEDIKEGKIKNKWIILSLIYAFLVYAVFFFMNKIDIDYIAKILLTIIISGILGFIFWLSKIWSAADGKLFLAYSALIPLAEYSNNYVPYFPSSLLLINTFAPFFLFASFKLIFLENFSEKLKCLKRIKYSELLMAFLNVFLMMGLSKVMMSLIGVNNFIVNFVFMAVLFIAFGKLLNKIWILGILCLARIIWDYNHLFSIRIINEIYSMLLMIILFLIMKLGSHFFTKTVRINELRPGMILADKICKKGKDYIKIEEDKIISDNKKMQVLSLESPAEGLTLDDVRKIKNLFKNKRLRFSVVKINQTIPFAPFMAFGVILTLLTKGIFLSAL